MAQIRYTTLPPDDTVFAAEYPLQMFATKQKSSGFQLHDLEDNYLNYMVVHGTDLKYKHGYLVSGTITGVDFKTGDGDDYVTITQAHYKITQKIDLSDVITAPAVFYLAAESGNDTITGSMESDVLYSQAGRNTLKGLAGDDTLVSGGRDTLTGNRGSDTFVFNGTSKIVITDFDANGGGKNQDYLYFDDSIGKPRIYEDHHNTVLDFGSGHTITLTGVDRADFSLVDDFKIPPVYEMM